jgi:hypothetical protein
MAKYMLGDVVKKEKTGFGTVRAIFLTKEGAQMYAIEKEGSFDFVEEARLSRQGAPELLA